MEITSMITLSTEHISEETVARFTEDRITGLTVYPKEDGSREYGWFIYFDKEVLDEDQDDVPKDIKDIAKVVFDNNCQMVCVDVDGPVEYSLPIYEWK